MRIYSFYDENAGKETLDEHVATALKLLDSAENSKLVKYGRKLIPEFERAAKLAIIFHDTGKVFFQIKKGYGYMNFRGHEYFSTYIFDVFACRLIKSETENYKALSELRKICNFSIYFHHHAMNIRMREPEVGNNIKAGLELLDVLYSKVKRFLEEKEKKALKAALEEVKEKGPQISNVTRYVKDEIVRRVWREVMDSSKLKRLCYLNLLVLIAADYSSAALNRGGNKTPFGRVVEEFSEFYLK